jgi:hypothetical protein
MEAIRSSETSINPGSTPRHIPEDDILHSHRCENLKSYIEMSFSLKLVFLVCLYVVFKLLGLLKLPNMIHVNSILLPIIAELMYLRSVVDSARIVLYMSV